MAYGGQEHAPDRKKTILRKKGQAQVKRIAKTMAAHAAKRLDDPMDRLVAIHELGAGLERALGTPDEPCPVPKDYYRQYDDYDPELERRKQLEREPGIESDYTLEEILLFFVPIEKLFFVGARAVGRGWTLVKGSKAFKNAFARYSNFLGPKLERFGLSVHTPLHQPNWAVQRWTPGAFRTRRKVPGQVAYKKGSFPKPPTPENPKGFSGSDVLDSRFLSREHPLVSPSYDSRHGLYSPTDDWVMRVRVKPGSPVIVRSAPPGPLGPGGAPEAVIGEKMLRMEWFHMP